MQFCKLSFYAAVAVCLTALLVACGGGTSPPQVRSLGVDSSLQTNASSYPVSSPELRAFDLLNAERVRCGFGALKQNFALDRAARAHARWTVLTGQLTHTEDGVRYPDEFTGAGVADRIVFQSYPLNSGPLAGSAGEVYAAFTRLPDAWDPGLSAVRLLLNAPYHLIFLTGSYRDVGVSFQQPADVGLTSGWDQVVMELAHTSAEGPQDLAADAIATYPCDGSAGLVYSLSQETPNPIPDRNLGASPLGVSVVIRVRQGQTLNIQSVTMADAFSGFPVAMRAHVGGGNGQTDPYQEFGKSVAYVVADAPMSPDTSYITQITGTNNGRAFVKRFTFKTGNVAFNAP